MYTKKTLKEASKKMGKKPANPIGTCFESSLWQIVRGEMPEGTKLCHAVITTNMPGAEAVKTGHAWIEFTHDDGKTVALDTTWMLLTPADHYRKQLSVEYLIEYSKQEAFENVLKTGNNAWDEKIKYYSTKKHLKAQN